MERADVVIVLERHVGKTAGVSAEKLVQQITGSREKNPGAERKLREYITALRMEGYPVCGHPTTGYYVAKTPAEVQETCSFLRSRAMTSLKAEARLKKLSLAQLLGQMSMELVTA